MPPMDVRMLFSLPIILAYPKSSVRMTSWLCGSIQPPLQLSSQLSSSTVPMDTYQDDRKHKICSHFRRTGWRCSVTQPFYSDPGLCPTCETVAGHGWLWLLTPMWSCDWRWQDFLASLPPWDSKILKHGLWFRHEMRRKWIPGTLNFTYLKGMCFRDCSVLSLSPLLPISNVNFSPDSLLIKFMLDRTMEHV